MPKAVAIFLSFFILVQGLFTYAAELEKMDMLLEHAQLHKEQFGDSFAAFMSKHYGKLKQEHDSNQENHDHEQLPFQQFTVLATTPVFLLANGSTEVTPPFNVENQDSNFHYQSLYSSLMIKEILQPPKHA